jgi:F420-dependent oxidoreductase-like protein
MIEGQQGVTWDGWLALAAACERSGLEGLFRSDLYLGIPADEDDPGSLDAWATLAALAARTERIRLGTMVSPATFRHPSVLAKSATTVDHVSGGRVELGLGAGWYEREHEAYGFPFPALGERMSVFEEQLEIVHRSWTAAPFSFTGRHYRLVDCSAQPAPLQRPHPPLIVGGAARPRSVAAAVRFAQEYNTIYIAPETARERRSILDAACEQAGRDPATLVFSLMTSVIVGETRDELHARARRQMDGDGSPAAFLRERAGQGAVVGTVDEVVEVLRAYEAAGVERLLAQHLDHDDVELVSLLGERVAPALAA